MLTRHLTYYVLTPAQRAHSPWLAKGLASKSENRPRTLTVEDSLPLAAGDLQS
jgi:hypothetical protein